MKKYFLSIAITISYFIIIFMLTIILIRQKNINANFILINKNLSVNKEILENQKKDITALLELIDKQNLKNLSFNNEQNNTLNKLLQNLITNTKNNNILSNNKLKLLYKETEIIDKENKAYKLYKIKEYAQAYKLYNEVREIDPSRLQTRYYWLCSKYYSNPMDINSFNEILDEIKYLKSQGILETKLLEIENNIQKEKEILKAK